MGKKLCIFHDPDYIKVNPEDLQNAFSELIDKKISENKPLFAQASP
jgi:hypothetical protein